MKTGPVAAYMGHMECLRYICEHDCPIDINHCLKNININETNIKCYTYLKNLKNN